MDSITKKIVLILFGLYGVSLFISIAGMEIFSTLLFIVAVVLFAKECIDKKKVAWNSVRLGPDIWLWSFFTIVVVSAFVNIEDSAGRFASIGYARWVLVLYSLAYLLRRYFLVEKIEKAIGPLMVLALIVGAYAVAQSFTGVDLIRPGESGVIKPMGALFRAVGPFRLPLTFAYAYGTLGFIFIAYSLFAIKYKSSLVKTLSVAVAIVTVLALLATGVRGSWLGLVVAGFVLFAFRGREVLVTAFVVFAVSLGGLAISFPGLQKRVVSIVNINHHSNLGRLKIWRASYEIFKANPVVGVGYNRTAEVIESYYKKLGIEKGQRGHAHNNYLQMLAGIGTLGFISYLGLIFYFLNLALQLYLRAPAEDFWLRSLALGGLCGQIFLHIGGLTECNFTDGEVNHALVTVWALLSLAAIERRESLESSHLPA